MANSLRAKLSKLRHDGHITDAEYQAFIKKMDGHDVEIRNKAIDEFAERLKAKVEEKISLQMFLDEDNLLDKDQIDKYIDEIAEQLKAGGKNV